jgi:hypothetical protein
LVESGGASSIAREQLGSRAAREPPRLGERHRARVGERGDDPRQARQRVAQLREVARRAAVRREPRRDPLEVEDAFEFLAERRVRRVEHAQFGDGVLPPDDRGDVDQRLRDPVAQQARAGGRARAVEDGEEGALAPPLPRRLEQLERLDRRPVEPHRAAARAAAQARDVREESALRVARVGEDRPGRADEVVVRLDAEAAELGDAQLLAERAARDVGLELVRRPPRERRTARVPRPERRELGGQGVAETPGEQQFGRREALELVGESAAGSVVPSKCAVERSSHASATSPGATTSAAAR